MQAERLKIAPYCGGKPERKSLFFLSSARRSIAWFAFLSSAKEGPPPPPSPSRREDDAAVTFFLDDETGPSFSSHVPVRSLLFLFLPAVNMTFRACFRASGGQGRSPLSPFPFSPSAEKLKPMPMAFTVPISTIFFPHSGLWLGTVSPFLPLLFISTATTAFCRSPGKPSFFFSRPSW